MKTLVNNNNSERENKAVMENGGKQDEPGARFKIGDRVRMKHDGATGTIASVWDGYDGFSYEVTRDVPIEGLEPDSEVWEAFPQESGLEPLEPASEITEQREQNDACISSAESRRDSTNGQIKAVCIEGVSLTAEKRTKWVKNFGDIIREHTTQGRETQYNHDCGCIRVEVAYRNDSDKPEDWTYCVSWYKWLDIVTEKRELVECENGVRLEQAARAMADFHLLADAGLTLQQILYPAA